MAAINVGKSLCLLGTGVYYLLGAQDWWAARVGLAGVGLAAGVTAEGYGALRKPKNSLRLCFVQEFSPEPRKSPAPTRPKPSIRAGLCPQPLSQLLGPGRVGEASQRNGFYWHQDAVWQPSLSLPHEIIKSLAGTEPFRGQSLPEPEL